MKKLLISAIVGLFVCVNSHASVFDNLMPSTRASALGGTFISMSDDTTCVFYNPASTADIKNLQLYFGYKNLYAIEGLDFSVFSMSKNIGKYGVLSLAYQGLITKYRDEKIESEDTYTLSHSFKFYEERDASLYFGYNVNTYALYFQGYGSDNAIGLDTGLYSVLRKKIRAGFTVKNFNSPKLGREFVKEIPHRLTMGLSYQPYYGVITAIEVEKEEAQPESIHAGCEFELLKYFKLRFGVATDPNLFTTGVNVTWNRIGVDYAYVMHPVLNDTHQFGLYLNF